MRNDSEAPSGATIGEVDFDPESGDLQGPGGDARLAPQPARLLELLVERRGSVVTRAEIAGTLWPAGKIDVDQGIGFAVREIRKGLEAAGGDPEALETIPRRGYRVHVASGDGALPDGGSDGEAASGIGRPRGSAAAPAPARRGLTATLLTAAGLVAILVILALVYRPGGGPVVVQFPHATDGGPGADAAAASLATALTTRLTASLDGEAGIIGPTGAASIADPNDMETARDLLGACLILSGMIRTTEDGRYDVFTQLVRTSDRVHVWAGRDTFPAADVAGSAVPGIVAGVRESVAGC